MNYQAVKQKRAKVMLNQDHSKNYSLIIKLIKYENIVLLEMENGNAMDLIRVGFTAFERLLRLNNFKKYYLKNLCIFFT